MERMKQFTRHLEWIEHGLLYGDDYLKTPETLTRNERQSALFLNNACEAGFLPYQYASDDAWHSACAKFYDGIMNSGLHVALQEALLLSRDIATDRVDGNMPLDAAARMADSRLLRLRMLAGHFVAPALAQSTAYYFATATKTIDDFLMYHLSVTIVMCAGLFMAFLLFYRPAIAIMDSEIKRIRQMLLLFPEDVCIETVVVSETAHAHVSGDSQRPGDQ